MERARECVSRVCCHRGTGPESGLRGTRRGSWVTTGNDVFPRYARGSLVTARHDAGRHGLLGGGDAHSPGPRKRGPDIKTLYYT